MSSSSSSPTFHLLSTTFSSISKTLPPGSLCVFPSSINSNTLPKLFSIPTSTPSSSRFVRNLAVASSFELDEDLSSDGDGDGDEEQRSNSPPDLKVHVGNLPWNVDSAALAGLFQRAGNVDMVEIVYDKVSGRSRGFGFVTMSSVKEVEAAVQQFNGYELEGRQLRVNSGPPPRKDKSSLRGQKPI